jgi:alanyl-tRNA synthetase
MVYGQKINVQNGFVTTIALSVIENMKGFYPYLIEQSSNIIDILNKEVSLFENTLGKGYKLFNESLNNSNILDGKTVFHLVDTYGFPFEIIKELASQRNVKVDDESFFKHLAAHKEISKSNTNVVGMDKQNIDLIEFTIPSTFDYDNLSLHNSKIIGMFDQSLNRKYESSSKIYLIFDKTPFYATSGGQSFDHGNIIINNVSFPVLDVIKSPNGQHLHLIDLNGNTVNVNDTADLIVDKQYRLDVSRNHTTEHILEFVMNSTIDKSIKQEGAFKSNEYFTFDFKYPSKLTQEQLTDIELNVNKYIKSNSNILTTHETYEEAKAANAVGHFSEVYSKISGKLRVVNIGSFNKEICGGTHVNNTSEIEQFIITKYTSKGAGQ